MAKTSFYFHVLSCRDYLSCSPVSPEGAWRRSPGATHRAGLARVGRPTAPGARQRPASRPRLAAGHLCKDNRGHQNSQEQKPPDTKHELCRTEVFPSTLPRLAFSQQTIAKSFIWASWYHHPLGPSSHSVLVTVFVFSHASLPGAVKPVSGWQSICGARISTNSHAVCAASPEHRSDSCPYYLPVPPTTTQSSRTPG